jgi:signal transduction histidine kinase
MLLFFALFAFALSLALGVALARQRAENKAYDRALADTRRESEILLRLSKDLEDSQSYYGIQQATGAAMRDRLKINNSWIYLASPERPDVIELLTFTGDQAGVVWTTTAILPTKGDAMLEEIMTSRHAVVVEDARTDPRTNKVFVEKEKICSLLNVPMLMADRLMGCLGMGTFGDEGIRRFTPEEIVFIETVASRTAVTIDRQRQFLISQQEQGERKKAEQEVRDLNRELDERVKLRTAALDAANAELEAFSYSVSHDLRTPLRWVDGFSLTVLEDYGDKLDEKGKEHLRRIRAGVQRMAGLIDDMLKLSHISREEMHMREVNLSPIAESIADELKRREPDRKVQFIIGKTHMVKGDSKLLRVALENLMGNAWKFTHKTHESKIEFGETKVGGETAFFVRDNGAGFDPAHEEKLFAPFQRLHSDAEFEGTGIGLATVKRVITRHGGRIWGEGKVGNGAVFYFVI